MSDEPKPAMVISGEKWWRFLYTYEFEGSTYGFEVVARSADEANARMKKIALALYKGQVDGNPIPASGGWLWVPLLTWWKNWRSASVQPRRG